MKIYISCNGLGMGHVGRSLAFADKLRARGDEVVFATWGPAVDFVEKNNYKCYRLPNLDWSDRNDGSIDLMKTTIHLPKLILRMLKVYRLEKQIIEKESPSIIIMDTNQITPQISKKLKIPSIYLTHQITFEQTVPIINKFLNYFHRLTFLKTDKVCICDFKYPDNIYPLSVLKDKKAVYIGPLIRENHKKDSKAKNKKKLCLILISGPKQSPYALEKRILKIEDALIKLKDWQFLIVAPSKHKSRNNIKYIQWLDDVHKYLDLCDILVSRSGYSTVCDALAYSKKSIFIPQLNQSEHEILAASLEKRHLAVSLRQKDIKELPELIEKTYIDTELQKNLDNFIFKKRSGVYNIIKIIDKLTKDKKKK